MSSIKRLVNSKEEIVVGSKVLVNEESLGIVRYIGNTSFQTGTWIGVELDDPEGKNSGVVKGKKYFDSKPNHGVFVKPANVKLQVNTRKTKTPKKATDPLQRRKSVVEPSKKPPEPQRRSAEPHQRLERRKSVVVDRKQEKKEPVRTDSPKKPETRRKSITESKPPETRRKSVIDPFTMQRRKSTVEPKKPPTMQRKSSVVAPASPQKKRPTSRNPLTAPSSPHLSDDDFDTLCNDNTIANSTPQIASPISLEKDYFHNPNQSQHPEEAQIKEAQIKEAQIKEAQIKEAQIKEAQIKEAQIKEAQLEEAQRLEALRIEYQQSEARRIEAERAREAQEAHEAHVAEIKRKEAEIKRIEIQKAESKRAEMQRMMMQRAEEQERMEQEDSDDDDDDNTDDEQTDESTEEESTVLGEEEMIKHEPKPVYGTLASTKPSSKAEQMIPLKDYEELRLRYNVLENKRLEDRNRFREYEKIKEEAEQFLTLRNKLQDKISDLQREVRDSRRNLKEMADEKDQLDSKYTEMSETLEIMAVDKEYAEVKAEDLQQEVNILRDRVAEISVDLEILQKQVVCVNSTDEKTPLAVAQLESHNERLKEALYRLRNITTEQAADLNLRIAELETENDELQDIRFQYEKTRDKLEAAEGLIENLKVQLDDAVGAEYLVERLTESNLNLAERNDEIQAALDDMEALKDLSDELEENHMETERQLQAEIDHRDMLLREQVSRLKANEETMMDYELTIEQFRELVTNLQTDLQNLKRKEIDDQSKHDSLDSQTNAMLSLKTQLQSTVTKAQAKMIDLELRKLEAAQANDRLNIIYPYLPESFSKTENDPISCFLLFKRLEFKSELIIKHLDQNYPVSEKIMQDITESLITICEIKQNAGWLSSLSIRFQTHIKNCDSETFSLMGKVYQEMGTVERKINNIIDQFRNNHVNETACLGELQRVISQIEHFVETNLVEEKDNANQFYGISKTLGLNADRMIVIFTFAQQLLNNAIKEDGLCVDQGAVQAEMDYMEPLGRLITLAKSSKIITKKLIRQLDDKFEEAMTLKSERLPSFKVLYSTSSKLCKFCFDIYKDLTSYIDSKRSGNKEIELSHIKYMLNEKSTEIFDIAESSLWETALRTLKSLYSELESTRLQIERDGKFEKITSKVAPWIQRASDIKTKVTVNNDLTYKLQQSNEDIGKLMRDIRIKEQTLQEADVKINFLEKRLNSAKKELEHTEALEEDLEKALKESRLCTTHMETMQIENDALEAEISKLKKEVNRREEKRQSMLRKSNFDVTSEDNTTMQEMASSYYEMSGQMDTLKNSVRYLRSENAHLKGLDYIRCLDLDMSDDSLVNNTTNQSFKSVARDTRVMIKDLRKASACPRIVKLNDKKSLDYQYQTQQSVLYTLQQRSVNLRTQLSNLHFTTKLDNKDSSNTIQSTKKLGLIKIPNLLSLHDTSKHCIHLKTRTEFNQIHNVFIQS